MTWISAGLAVGAAALALALGVLVAVLARRRPRGGRDVEALVRDVEARMAAMTDELRASLDAARAESVRVRRLADIGATIDIDVVLTRALEAARAVAGIDAAMISLPGTGAEPLVATLGLSAEESARHVVPSPPDGSSPSVTTVAYRYPPAAGLEPEDLIRGGLAIGLVDGEGEPIGTLSAFWRRRAQPSEESIAELEALAAGCGTALGNARRFREARQQADLDALTNLHNRRFFHQTLGREVARAQRYDRRLALVVLDIDDFKAVNDRIGHLAGDSVLAEVAGLVSAAVRGADVACRVGGDEFAVILPESTLADAEQLYERLRFAIADRPVSGAERLRVSAGIAELRPEDSALAFFERADAALYAAKESGKGHSVAADRA